MRTYVTITDKNGTQKYEFSSNFRRNFIFGIATILIIFAVLIFGLYMLKTQSENYKSLSARLYADNLALNSQNKELLQNIKTDKENKLKDYINESNNEQIEAAFSASDLKESREKVDTAKTSQKSIQARLFASIPNAFPLVNRGVTDDYGMRIHPISKARKMHEGIDLRAKIGTKVYATANGVVEYAAKSGTGYGYLVIISHNFGFKTRYAHLDEIDVVSVGQFVKKGELIGYSGNTGYSTGPHLHYEVRFLERTLDPINFIRWSENNQNEIFQNERKVPWQSLVNAVADF